MTIFAVLKCAQALRVVVGFLATALCGSLVFFGQPLALVGTPYIIVAAYAVRSLPASVRAGVASLQQIDPSIEEASNILGGDAQYTFRNVTLPLILPAFFAGSGLCLCPPHDQPVGRHLPDHSPVADSRRCGF